MCSHLRLPFNESLILIKCLVISTDRIEALTYSHRLILVLSWNPLECHIQMPFWIWLEITQQVHLYSTESVFPAKVMLKLYMYMCIPSVFSVAERLKSCSPNSILYSPNPQCYLTSMPIEILETPPPSPFSQKFWFEQLKCKWYMQIKQKIFCNKWTSLLGTILHFFSFNCLEWELPFQVQTQNFHFYVVVFLHYYCTLHKWSANETTSWNDWINSLPFGTESFLNFQPKI